MWHKENDRGGDPARCLAKVLSTEHIIPDTTTPRTYAGTC
jgi:hypothetical protein